MALSLGDACVECDVDDIREVNRLGLGLTVRVTVLMGLGLTVRVTVRVEAIRLNK